MQASTEQLVHVVVDPQHANMIASLELTTGTSARTVLLQQHADVAMELPRGTVLGTAIPLKRVDDSGLEREPIARPTAVEVYCGAGGMAEGIQPYFDVKLAVDSDARALDIYANNHVNTETRQLDMTLPSTRQQLIQSMRELGASTLLGGPPCTRYSMAGTRETALGIHHLYYMLEVGMAAECCRLLIIENGPGLQSAPELPGFLAATRAGGFSAQETLLVKGKDAHLVQTRDRVFYLLARPAAGEHDAARMHAAMAHARELLAHAKSQAAYTSVREATANILDSRGERREFFTSVGRNRSAKQVFSMDGPAPTTRHNHTGATPAQQASPRKCARATPPKTLTSTRAQSTSHGRRCALCTASRTLTGGLSLRRGRLRRTRNF